MDQWKTWTLVVSVFALKGELGDNHLEVWRAFALACQILCTPIITDGGIKQAELLLQQFYVEF